MPPVVAFYAGLTLLEATLLNTAISIVLEIGLETGATFSPGNALQELERKPGEGYLQRPRPDAPTLAIMVADLINSKTPLRSLTFDGFDERRKLIGPIPVFGECQLSAGLRPGMAIFIDPLAPLRDGDIAAFKFLPGGALGAKQIRFLAGHWWTISDTFVPMQLTQWESPIGRVAAAMDLPSGSITAEHSRTRTGELEPLPADFVAEATGLAAAAIAELEQRRPPTQAVWRRMTLPSLVPEFLFWSSIGAQYATIESWGRFKANLHSLSDAGPWDLDRPADVSRLQELVAQLVPACPISKQPRIGG